MVIFTEKMPENCRSCPCADGEYGVCNIDYSVALSADDRPKDCPLQEEIHAHWVIIEYEYLNCSHCGESYYTGTESTEQAKEWLEKGYAYSYCPYCGAKMDEKEKGGEL